MYIYIYTPHIRLIHMNPTVHPVVFVDGDLAGCYAGLRILVP